MANTAQARKRVRQAEKRREQNMAHRSKVRTFIKNTVKAIESGDKAKAQEAFNAAVPVIDTMANKGILHKNKAARHKQRLNAQIRDMG